MNVKKTLEAVCHVGRGVEDLWRMLVAVRRRSKRLSVGFLFFRTSKVPGLLRRLLGQEIAVSVSRTQRLNERSGGGRADAGPGLGVLESDDTRHDHIVERCRLVTREKVTEESREVFGLVRFMGAGKEVMDKLNLP